MVFYPISTLHSWNSRLMPVLGVSLNFLLFWLVCTKTPKEMRVHSRILLQTCYVDFMFLSLYLVVAPLLISQGSTTIVLLDGYLIRAFASIFNYHPMGFAFLNYIAGICVTFDILSITVQFLYRYLTLNRNIQITLGRYLLMLAFVFATSSIVVIIYALNFVSGSAELFLDVELKNSLNDYIDWENAIYLAGTNNEMFWIVSFLAMAIFYSINIFCGIKLVKFVAAHAVNPRTKELNQQLTKTLVILAFMPLQTFIYLTIIFLLNVVMYFTGIKSLAKTILCIQTFGYICGNWLPVVNPLVSIWINRPYRDAVKKFVASLFKDNSTTTPVQPLNHYSF